MLDLVIGLALAAMVNQSEATVEEHQPDAKTQVVRTTVIDTYPDLFRAYMDCRMGAPEEVSFGETTLFTYNSFTEDDCNGELRKLAVRQEAGQAVNPSLDAAFNQFYLDRIENTSLPATVTFLDSDKLGRIVFTVPNGMWEYHLCRSENVYRNGKIAEPKFPDDKNCELSKTYSRREAMDHLERTESTLSLEEREELVDGYFEAIDKRTADRATTND